MILWWNLNFLHGIRVGYSMCEAKQSHALHVTPLCCPHVKLENSPHVRERVENESHINERMDFAWAYKRLGFSPCCQLVLWCNPNFLPETFTLLEHPPFLQQRESNKKYISMKIVQFHLKLYLIQASLPLSKL
ncbi:hypothetical protein DVH24_036143 [Malus domestica]|uniref:Uncharacterized protein n=1 Tax=Malus domestica TaxID=3750 RepID=A0A498IIC6_MALDO|nr:hypothetical protein DVH24_036143 [Malus domestica]